MTHSTPPDRYAVLGNPIAHSKSPMIHALFAEQTKQDIVYTKQLVELGQFEQAAKKFFDEGGKGLNVTVPFKLDAFAFAKKYGRPNNELSGTASLAQAVNTLVISDDGYIFGDNTDGVGLINDLRNKSPFALPSNPQFNLYYSSVLILGAGGAVRGVLSKILEEKFTGITIANRTESTAIKLADEFNQKQSKLKINGCGYQALDNKPVDIIINGTSASLSGALPALPDGLVRKNTICYDMVYGKEDTAFMQWAKKSGSEFVFDGLGMLVEQAAESFYLWRGVRPQTKPVIDFVRSQL